MRSAPESEDTRAIMKKLLTMKICVANISLFDKKHENESFVLYEYIVPMIYG